MTKEKKTGLELLREPFPANQISKLPKPTKAQTDEVRNNFKAGIRCKECGQWHHPNVVHLDYVGHAALTDRLLDCDPQWNWSPVAFAPDGTPAMDANGGMWIKLTVCGVERLGYGHPDGKKGGDAIKEVIGDALRNAAMRFGAALDLWHKGDLHADEPAQDQPAPKSSEPAKPQERNPDQIRDALIAQVNKCQTADQVNDVIGAAKFDAAWQWLAENHEPHSAAVRSAVDAKKNAMSRDLGGDNIPY